MQDDPFSTPWDADDPCEAECLAYPVEVPLTAEFDPESGVLVVESTIQQHAGARRFVRLRLSFSAEAAYGFVRLLKELENEFGIVVAARVRPAPLQ